MKLIAYGLANITAMIGGLVLLAIITMTVASVIGRSLIFAGLGPIPGDFEVTEVTIAFAIFCFLPLCHLIAGHATVDVFTSGMGAQANRVLLAIWEVALTLTMIFIAWRLFQGFLGKLANNEITMLLQFPIWWGYGAALLPAFVGVFVGIWSAYDRIFAALHRIDTRAIEGASH